MPTLFAGSANILAQISSVQKGGDHGSMYCRDLFKRVCGFVSLGDIYKLNVDPEKVREAKDKIDAFTSTASKDLMLVRDDTLCRTILITALHVTYEPSLSWWRGAPGLTFIDLDWAIEKKDYGIVLLAPSIEQFPENRIADYFRIPTDNSKLEVYANKNCYVSAS